MFDWSVRCHGFGPASTLAETTYGHLDMKLTLWLSIVSIDLFWLAQADPPDPALASHWLKLSQTNALSLTNRKLIGTGKSLGQLINITAGEKNKNISTIKYSEIAEILAERSLVTTMSMSGLAEVRSDHSDMRYQIIFSPPRNMVCKDSSSLLPSMPFLYNKWYIDLVTIVVVKTGW